MPTLLCSICCMKKRHVRHLTNDISISCDEVCIKQMCMVDRKNWLVEGNSSSLWNWFNFIIYMISITDQTLKCTLSMSFRGKPVHFSPIWSKYTRESMVVQLCTLLLISGAEFWYGTLKVKTSIGNAPISKNEMEALITNHVKEYVLTNTWWYKICRETAY